MLRKWANGFLVAAIAIGIIVPVVGVLYATWMLMR